MVVGTLVRTSAPGASAVLSRLPQLFETVLVDTSGNPVA
jgi:hypothetical protein